VSLLKKEWAHILFTTFVPTAVGTGVVLCGLFDYIEFHLIFPASLCISIFLFATFIISALPVGHRLRIPRVIRNILRSWLSREFFLVSGTWLLYLAAAGAYYYRIEYQIQPLVTLYLFGSAGVVGLMAVLLMQRTYRFRSIPLWTGNRTLTMFISTTFLLGTISAIGFLYIFADKSMTDMMWRLFPIFSLPLLCDLFQLVELISIRRRSAATAFALLRLPVYLAVFNSLGRIHEVLYLTVIVIALSGDIFLRIVFFREEPISFGKELGRARRQRLVSSGS